MLAESAADADADAAAEADAEVAIEAPTPGIAKFIPVRLFSEASPEVSFNSSANAAAAGPSKAESNAPRPGKLAFIDRADTFKLAAALAPNGGRPRLRERLARASRRVMADAENPSDAEPEAAALAEPLAPIAALAAALNRPTPIADARKGPSICISIASGRFLSCAAMAASWLTHMQLTMDDSLM